MSKFETRETQNPKSCASASSATPAVVALFYKLGWRRSTVIWGGISTPWPLRERPYDGAGFEAGVRA
jgi:hypothetical protein